MKGPHNTIREKFTNWFDKAVYSRLQKFNEIPVSGEDSGHDGTVEPVFERQFDPRWIYHIRRRSSLINNAVEEKVNQTVRRGWGDWEKEWAAKCPNCSDEFGSESDFIEDYHPDDVDIDFSKPRECPSCGEMEEMITPDPEVRQKGREFLERANTVTRDDDHLEPDDVSTVSQSLMEVLREVSFDIESFDEGWAVINRKYDCTEEGRIVSYEPVEVYRAPPEKMRYSVDEETGHFGGEYWVCLNCRQDPNYTPEKEDRRCSECGNVTYEVYAYALEGIRDGEPSNYYIRGEFLHRSLYEPSRFYGYSPIVSLYDEAMTLNKMDEWYREAYQHRRAPRGALAIKSSNAQSTQDWNKKQFEKMRNDPNHIPTLMDDGETDGNPIEFITLLESPAEMQHMEMRNWMKERISAKWGVTPIFQGSPSESGLSQSMEIQVSNRAADRLRTVLNEGFVAPLMSQLGIDGWTIGIAPVEEENEQHQVELQLKHLQAAQQAVSMGLDVEWTDEDRAAIKPGDIEEPEDGGEMGAGGMDGLGGMLDGEGGPEMDETGDGPEDGENVQEAAGNAGGDTVDLGASNDGTGGMGP